MRVDDGVQYQRPPLTPPTTREPPSLAKNGQKFHAMAGLAGPLRAAYQYSIDGLILTSLRTTTGDSFVRVWDEPARRVVHVVGDAGAGKSVLLRRLARDWARGELWRNQWDALVVVDWSATAATSLVEAVAEQGPSMEWARELLEWSAGRTLWLFDGLDALAETRREEVRLLLAEPPGAMLFVSRPGMEWLRCDTRLSYRCELSPEELLRFVHHRTGGWSATTAATTLYLCIRHHPHYAALRPIAAARICEPLLYVEHEVPPVYARVRQLLQQPLGHDVSEAFRTPAMATLLMEAAAASGDGVQLTALLAHVVTRLLERFPAGPTRDELRVLGWQRWWEQSDEAARHGGTVPGLFEQGAFASRAMWSEFFAAEFVSHCLDATAAEAVLVAARTRNRLTGSRLLQFLYGIGAPHVMASHEMWGAVLSEDKVVCLEMDGGDTLARSLRYHFGLPNKTSLYSDDEAVATRDSTPGALLELSLHRKCPRAAAFFLTCGVSDKPISGTMQVRVCLCVHSPLIHSRCSVVTCAESCGQLQDAPGGEQWHADSPPERLVRASPPLHVALVARAFSDASRGHGGGRCRPVGDAPRGRCASRRIRHGCRLAASRSQGQRASRGKEGGALEEGSGC